MSDSRGCVGRFTTTIVPLIATLAVLLAACDSGSSSTTSTSSTSATASPSSYDFGAKDVATGSPVTLGLINSEGGQTINSPEVREGAQAAAKYANQYLGGIAGHPIVLDICKTDGTATSSQNCANQLVDNHVDAVVMGVDSNTGVIVPIVTGAGIPYVTGGGVAPAEFITPNAFSWTGGVSSIFGGMAALSDRNGWKKFTVMLINVADATAGADTFAIPAFKKAKVSLNVVAVPPGTADMTPVIEAAEQKGSDAYGLIGDESFCISAMKAMQSLGVTKPKVLIPTCTGTAVAQAVGQSFFNGSYSVVSTEATGNDPEAKLYRAVMATFAPGVDPYGLASGGYASLLGLVRALKGLTGTVSPATIISTIKTARDVPLPAGDGITFTCNGSASSILTSICSTQEIAAQIVNGQTKVLGIVPG